MSSTSITFGVSVRQSLALGEDGVFDARAYAEAVAHAESLGIDHVMAADHVFVPPYMARRIGDFFLDPLALLSYLAAATTHIDLVLSCLVVPYRQPLTTAKAIASLDQMSAGRCVLGVVPGYVKEEFDAFGLPLDRRGAMTDEFVSVMRELWTEDEVSFSGEFSAFDGVRIRPHCARRPHVPIWVGGSSASALRRVVEYGDGWMPLGFTVIDDAYRAAYASELDGRPMPTSGTTPERLRSDLARIGELADARGRDISELEVVVYVGPPVDDTGRPLQDASGQIVQGGPAVVDWLGRYVDGGATGFVVSPSGSSLAECRDQLEAFTSGVMAEMKGRRGAPATPAPTGGTDD